MIRHLIGPKGQPKTIIVLYELNIKPIPNDISPNPQINTSPALIRDLILVVDDSYR